MTIFFSVNATSTNDTVICKFEFVFEHYHSIISGMWYNEMCIMLSGSGSDSSQISHLISGKIWFWPDSKKTESDTSLYHCDDDDDDAVK